MTKVGNYRRFLNYTQSDMSKLLGISLQAYWKKEKGKTAFNDEEKKVITNAFKKELPEVTITDIFFTQEVSKVE